MLPCCVDEEANRLRLPELDRMTAEEVITGRNLGLIMASPALSRLRIEPLDPAVIRVFY